MRHCNMQRTRSLFSFIIVTTCILCLLRVTSCDESAANRNGAGSEEAKAREKPVSINNNDVIKPNQSNNNNNTEVEQHTKKNITSQSVTTIVDNKLAIENTSSPPEATKDGHQPTVTSGALLRGFYVLAGLSVIALAYMVFRSFGLNKQRPQMVRKYGILAHRQDIEMRPLPLDEDDDDDTTVFDATGLTPLRAES